MSKLPSELLARFALLIEKEIGLFYPKERYSDLEDALRFSLKINDEKILKDYINNYLNSESYTKLHHDELSQALTIGETYYFRKGSGFEQMEQIIIPSLIQEKANSDRSIRIWSAGCSQGDEPYSIAILIDKLLPNREGWNIHILGTDINKKSLEKAESGIARKWSFRSLDEDIVNRYFTKINDVEYKILPSIKNMVSFGYLNLIEDYYPSLENGTNALDLVLCNNTLMYFSPLQIEKVVRNLLNCLLSKGYFIVAPVESSYVKDDRVKTLDACNVFIKGAHEKKLKSQNIKEQKKEPPQLEKAIYKESQIPLKEEVVKTPSKIKTSSFSFEELYKTGDFQNCIDLLEGKSLDDTNASILIRCSANQGRLTEAENICRERLKQNSLSPIFHFLLANILQEQNKLEEAILELKRTLFLNKDFIMAHFSLAHLFHAQHKEKESKIHRRAVIEGLKNLKNDAIVPGSDHMLAGRLREITINMGESNGTE